MATKQTSETVPSERDTRIAQILCGISLLFSGIGLFLAFNQPCSAGSVCGPDETILAFSCLGIIVGFLLFVLVQRHHYERHKAEQKQ